MRRTLCIRIVRSVIILSVSIRLVKRECAEELDRFFTHVCCRNATMTSGRTHPYEPIGRGVWPWPCSGCCVFDPDAPAWLGGHPSRCAGFMSALPRFPVLRSTAWPAVQRRYENMNGSRLSGAHVQLALSFGGCACAAVVTNESSVDRC